MTPRRRAALAGLSLAAALVASACSVVDGDAGADGADPAPTEDVSTTSTLAPPVPYALHPGEPAPEVKELAVRVLEAIGTYEAGGGTVEGARARIATLPADAAVAVQAGPLLVPETGSALDVVYPQLGGLTDDAASVMTVVRHRTLDAGGAAETTRTVDVRLHRDAAGWRVTSLASTGGTPTTAPATSAVGTAVLANPGLDLPDSARWDIEAGRIDDSILSVLDRLGRSHRLSVTVLATGHPHEVFGATSVSNHTEGRAVDVWAVDGTPVVTQQDVGGPIYELVEQLLAEGITELGSPWDLDGAGRGASFTNTVHKDHLHIGFDGP